MNSKINQKHYCILLQYCFINVSSIITGVVTLKSEVDHEETQWINVTVRAQDMGAHPLASTAVLQVQIEDVNDNSPVWQDFPEEVWVSGR